MRVVCQREGDAGLAVDFDNALRRALFLRDAVVLNLKVEVFFSEHIPQLSCQGARLVVPVFQNKLRYRARETAGQTDKPLRVRLEQLPVDAGLDVETLRERRRDKAAEVMVAGFVFAQQDKVAVIIVNAVLLAVHTARRDIDLAPDYRLYAAVNAGLVKRDRTVHHAVVGNGEGGLPQLLCARNDPLDAASAVEQGVFRVHMQVNKAHFRCPFKC